MLFARDQISEALARWPDLDDDLKDPDSYCRSIEGTLRVMSATDGKRPTIGPLNVETLIRFADEHGLVPGSGAARSQLAADRYRRGEARAWPPGRTMRAGVARIASTSAPADRLDCAPPRSPPSSESRTLRGKSSYARRQHASERKDAMK